MAQAELDIADLTVDAGDLSRSTVSEHLHILKTDGIIPGEITGPCIGYALTTPPIPPAAYRARRRFHDPV